ncbi:MAG: T9SS type A sorting domain-containing protein [Bacteroidetes bacterium]|nr:T9SS type A sorting domain-containing protein [Bacteroidota bacterium]
MYRNILTILFAVMVSSVFSQVPKKIVVEHFTNTRCGVCASKNPGLYENLNNNPDVLHLAIHPGSPYQNCWLHLHNPGENDGRTNYYGIYGATPRLVIQGEAKSAGINFSDPALFSPYESQTSPYSLYTSETRLGGDSVRVDVTVKAVAAHSLSNAKIFLAYAEEILPFAAPNGETQHHDVFRKAFTPVEGMMIDLPANGDSVIISLSIAIDTEWNMDQMYALAILQDAVTKEVLQAGKTDMVNNIAGIFSNNVEEIRLGVYPNPARESITVGEVSGMVEIIGIDGKTALVQRFDEKAADRRIDISILPEGVYIVRNGIKVSRLSITR